MRLSLSCLSIFFFFFNDTATTEIYPLSLHDALPISSWAFRWVGCCGSPPSPLPQRAPTCSLTTWTNSVRRSEEHTSELQSQSNLVCRLLLEKKKKKRSTVSRTHATRHLVSAVLEQTR